MTWEMKVKIRIKQDRFIEENYEPHFSTVM